MGLFAFGFFASFALRFCPLAISSSLAPTAAENVPANSSPAPVLADCQPPTAARRARRHLGWRLKRDCEIDLTPCASALLELSLCACSRRADQQHQTLLRHLASLAPIQASYDIRHISPEFGGSPSIRPARERIGHASRWRGDFERCARACARLVGEPCERRGRYKVERLMAEHGTPSSPIC